MLVVVLVLNLVSWRYMHYSTKLVEKMAIIKDYNSKSVLEQSGKMLAKN